CRSPRGPSTFFPRCSSPSPPDRAAEPALIARLRARRREAHLALERLAHHLLPLAPLLRRQHQQRFAGDVLPELLRAPHLLLPEVVRAPRVRGAVVPDALPLEHRPLGLVLDGADPVALLLAQPQQFGDLLVAQGVRAALLPDQLLQALLLP